MKKTYKLRFRFPGDEFLDTEYFSSLEGAERREKELENGGYSTIITSHL